MTRMTLALALSLLAAAPAAAQTAPPPTTPPPPVQTPPPAKPAAQTPPPAPQKPAVPPPQVFTFPADSKIAFVDLQQLLSQSTLGKDGSARLEALGKSKQREVEAMQTLLKVAQDKQRTQASVLSEPAAATLAKDIARQERELQFKSQEAQAELQQVEQDLLQEFQAKVVPVINAYAKEKGLYAVFTIGSDNSNAIFVYAGLNISDDIIKRLDAMIKK